MIKVPFLVLDNVENQTFASNVEIINRLPSDGEVVVNGEIRFDLVDTTLNGIDVTSLNVTINGVPVVVGGIASTGWTLTTSTVIGSWWTRFVLTPSDSWPQWGDLRITVYGENTNGDSGSWTWNARLPDFSPPRIAKVSVQNRYQLDVTFDQPGIAANALSVVASFPWGNESLEYVDGKWQRRFIAIPHLESSKSEPFHVYAGKYFSCMIDGKEVRVQVTHDCTTATEVANELDSLLRPHGGLAWSRGGKVYVGSMNNTGSISVPNRDLNVEIGFPTEEMTRSLLYGTSEGTYTIDFVATFPSIVQRFSLDVDLQNETRDFVLTIPDDIPDGATDPSNWKVRLVDKGDRLSVFIPSVKRVLVPSGASGRVTLVLDQDMTPGALYAVSGRNMTDLNGNVIDKNHEVEFLYHSEDCQGLDFYALFPEYNRRNDNGDFRKFASVVQEAIDVLLCDAREFGQLWDPDRASERAIELLLQSQGNPFRFYIDDELKRKLVVELSNLYRLKGTAQGIKDAIRFFLGFSDVDVIPLYGSGWVLAEDTLGHDTILDTGSLRDRFSFWVVVHHEITDEEREIIRQIALTMKTSHTHLAAIKDPTTWSPPDHWKLPFSRVRYETWVHES